MIWLALYVMLVIWPRWLMHRAPRGWTSAAFTLENKTITDDINLLETT